MLEAGTQAPDFTLNDQDGNPVTLSDLRGKKVVLYFYPKDSTAGCTTQALNYNELLDQFHEKDALVFGISKDGEASHRKFRDKQGLKFTLLSDPEHKVNELYDVWKEKSMYGKKYFGTVRSSYLIDEDGVIVAAAEKVKPALDAKNVLKALEELK